MTGPDTVRVLRARAQALAGGERERSAYEVVRRVLAVQAQDATAADLGIRVRARDLTLRDVRAAYEDERSIVRGWFMRGTLHTVPAEDVRGLLRLLGPGLLAATGRRYGQLGLDEGLRERSDRLIRRTLAAHGPLTRAELTAHLATLGVPPDGQAPIHLIRHAALTGVLCHGPCRDADATYVLLDDWLPAAGPASRDEETARTDLARRYLAAYGPATPQDFAAWSGLPLGAARGAWKDLAGSGALVGDGTRDTLADHPHGLADPPATSGTPDVRMLPAYDNYLLGYRTRDLSVPVAHQPRVRPGGGVIRPTVIADGLAVATWSRSPVRIDPFAPLPPSLAPLLAAETDAVTRFLGAS